MSSRFAAVRGKILVTEGFAESVGVRVYGLIESDEDGRLEYCPAFFLLGNISRYPTWPCVFQTLIQHIVP